MRSMIRCILVLTSAIALAQCSPVAPAEPITDVDVARHIWVTSAITNYTFELGVETSWFPRSGYTRIRVVNGAVASTTPPPGEQAVSRTIEALWTELLDARARGDLNNARFDARGVPIETDIGPWPVDGGIRYHVRGFTRDP